MRTRWHFFGIAIAGMVSLVCLALIIATHTPAQAVPTIKALFFFSLFILLWTVLILAVSGIRIKLRKQAAEIVLVPIVAQTFILAVIIMLSLLVRHAV